jgi:hypothetical protein
MVAHGVYAAGASAIVGNRPYSTLAAVAAVSGVGASTMRGLHQYASSGTWMPGVEPPPPPPPPAHEPATNECVFGLTYRDVLRGEAIVVIAKRVVDPATDTNASQRAQILLAVQSTYTDVTTLTQAFAAVDDNRVNQAELWDASNRRAYTAYEFGAGDNSYGLIFEHGTTNVAARIIDLDLYDCVASWGNEMRPCERTVDCAEGLTCTGTSEDVSTGRCINTRAPRPPADGMPCQNDGACGIASGLVCAGVSQWGPGTCGPAWMRGHFESDFTGAAIPDNSPAGVTVSLPVYGLATVPTDIRMDLVISHPRVSDLSVTLINPSGTENVFIPAGSMSGPEISLRDAIVRSFPGDESVNGIWQIRVVDNASGSTGTVSRFGMTVGSRWD